MRDTLLLHTSWQRIGAWDRLNHGQCTVRRCAERILIPKIIVLTNYSMPETREKCFCQGGGFVFDKSGEIEEIR